MSTTKVYILSDEQNINPNLRGKAVKLRELDFKTFDGIEKSAYGDPANRNMMLMNRAVQIDTAIGSIVAVSEQVGVTPEQVLADAQGKGGITWVDVTPSELRNENSTKHMSKLFTVAEWSMVVQLAGEPFTVTMGQIQAVRGKALVLSNS